MKTLISAEKVKQAHKDGKNEIVVEKGRTIITPEARTAAQKLGIKLVESSGRVDHLKSGPSGGAKTNPNIDEAVLKKIMEQVVQKLPTEKHNPEVIKKTVLEVLKNYNK